MYLYSTTFHTPKPCHLSLGKLVYCYGKFVPHLVIRKLPNNILRDKSVLQTILKKNIHRYASFQKSANFIHHSLFKTHIQSSINTSIANFTAHKRTNKIWRTRQPIYAYRRTTRAERCIR